ncbi:hypothetical protein GCM10020000_04460 [Streptomyces olivoverticillatus]
MRHPVGEVGEGQDRPYGGVGDDVGQAVLREADVQRNVNGVCFQYAQHSRVGIHRVVDQQADPVAGANALAHEETGESICSFVQLCIGQCHVAGVHRELALPALRP